MVDDLCGRWRFPRASPLFLSRLTRRWSVQLPRRTCNEQGKSSRLARVCFPHQVAWPKRSSPQKAALLVRLQIYRKWVQPSQLRRQHPGSLLCRAARMIRYMFLWQTCTVGWQDLLCSGSYDPCSTHGSRRQRWFHTAVRSWRMPSPSLRWSRAPSSLHGGGSWTRPHIRSAQTMLL